MSHHRLCAAFAVLASFPSVALAGELQPLPGMLSGCSFLCTGGFGFETCLFPDTPGGEPEGLFLLDEELNWQSETCLQPGAPPFEDLFFTAAGDVQTVKGDRPFAQASVTAMSDSDPGTGTALLGDFSSRVRLEYFARVEQDAAPPFAPGGVPVTIEARFESIESGPCGNVGDVDVLRGGTIVMAWNPNAGNAGPLAVDQVVAVNELVFFGLSAIATAFTGPGNLATSCSSITDPLFTFDQEAFDAEWGAASYPLADYFTVRSAAAAVPEPAAPAQLVAGAAVLVALARRRFR